jgi:hypothetical protein
MDPLLICFVIAAWLTHVAKEVPFAVRGQTSPRMQMRLADTERRRNKPHWSGTGRYGGREFFAGVWHDSWEDAHHSRARMRARKHERLEAGTHWTQRTRRGAATVAGYAKRGATEMRNRFRDKAIHTAIAPETPEEQTLEIQPYRTDTLSGELPLTEQTVPDQRSRIAQALDPERLSTPDPRGAEAELATVTPINERNPEMPSPTGETIGLSQTLAYTKSMAETAQHGAASVEQSIANLQSSEVSGAPLAHLSSGQDHLAQAAAAFTAAHQELSKQTAVRDAYSAVGKDAGSKQFVTAE